MECPKHLFAKILCHGKTSLFSWQIINYPPPLPKSKKTTQKNDNCVNAPYSKTS